MTDYQRFLQENLAISQGLVGSFNEEDKYVVSQDSIQEIVGAKKMLTSYKDTEALCELCTPNNTYKLKFRFTIDVANNKKYASLYLLESFNLYDEKQELDTFLINYCEANDNNFLDKLKKAFNLITKDESQGKDIKNSALKFETLIIEKKDKLKAMSAPFMMQNKKYIQDVLKILKASGASGDEILKIFKKEISKIPVDKLDPKYWQTTKDILDKILYKNAVKLPQEYRKQMEEVNQQFIKLFKDKFKGISLVVATKAPQAKKPMIPKPKPKAKAKEKGKEKSAGGKDKGKDSGKGKAGVEDKKPSIENVSKPEKVKDKDIDRLHPPKPSLKIQLDKEIMFGMKMGKYLGVMSYINELDKDKLNDKTIVEQPKTQGPKQNTNNINKYEEMELSR